MGIPGLDRVCGGGFVKGAIYLFMGRPGTGKTTLGNQLCFAHAKQGGRSAYLTLLAESHASMLRNLQQMRFFDPSVINNGVSYVGAYRALRDGQLRGLLDMVRRVIKDEKATLLVIDGITPARALAETELALKEFVVELQMLSSMMGCTTILLANMTAEDANGPEHTMVDGLVELAFERHKRRTTRTIEVLKFRGSRHVLGKSELLISELGMEAFPRVEEVMNGTDRPPPSESDRVGSGIPGLDEMLGGGFVKSTTSVVLGFSGSGKTTLGLHFLDAGAEAGENTLLFGFHESPSRLLQAADTVGLNLGEYTREGRFVHMWRPPHQMGPDQLGAQLLEQVDRRNVQRLVIDSLDGFRLASSDQDRTIQFVTAVVNELRARNVTVVITDETLKLSGPEVEMRIDGMSALVDNLILLRYVSVGFNLRRLIYVLKERASDHELTPREFLLKGKGIHISSDGASASEIVSATSAFPAPYARRDSGEF
ncbi:MAG TPA: ATPase domain-containing protein [Polyangiaceae bacterium]|nr:ATPase domain-containing protein [Polyangiaceae bacterium]